MKPPAPPPGYGTSQSGVQQLAARLGRQQQATAASEKPLCVTEEPLKSLIALVVQMQFGSADKAELLIAELLGIY